MMKVLAVKDEKQAGLLNFIPIKNSTGMRTILIISTLTSFILAVCGMISKVFLQAAGAWGSIFLISSAILSFLTFIVFLGLVFRDKKAVQKA